MYQIRTLQHRESRMFVSKLQNVSIARSLWKFRRMHCGMGCVQCKYSRMHCGMECVQCKHRRMNRGICVCNVSIEEPTVEWGVCAM